MSHCYSEASARCTVCGLNNGKVEHEKLPCMGTWAAVFLYGHRLNVRTSRCESCRRDASDVTYHSECRGAPFPVWVFNDYHSNDRRLVPTASNSVSRALSALIFSLRVVCTLVCHVHSRWIGGFRSEAYALHVWNLSTGVCTKCHIGPVHLPTYVCPASWPVQRLYGHALQFYKDEESQRSAILCRWCGFSDVKKLFRRCPYALVMLPNGHCFFGRKHDFKYHPNCVDCGLHVSRAMSKICPEVMIDLDRQRPWFAAWLAEVAVTFLPAVLVRLVASYDETIDEPISTMSLSSTRDSSCTLM